MKKLLSLALVLVMVLTFASCGEATNGTGHDFRNVDFGMSAEQVKTAEASLELTSESSLFSMEVLTYNLRIDTTDYTLTYSLDEDMMDTIMVESEPSASYVSDYEMLKGYLIDTYGKPDNEMDDAAVWNVNKLIVTVVRHDNKQYTNAIILPDD